MHDFYKTFKLEDDRYMKHFNMTKEDLDRTIDRLTDIHSKSYNLIGTTRNHPSNIVNRSLLPLGNILGFLFGTASSGDIKGLKKDIQTLYANQVKHGEILNEVITITNISRGLIHENRLTINNLIDSAEFLNETLVNIHEDIEPLFVTRRFLLVHDEVQIHSHRLRASIDKINDDVNHLGVSVYVLSTGKLSPDTVDPIHLGKELTDIQKQLTPTLRLPEDPTTNIWHFYKYLTVTPIVYQDRLMMLIKIPLIDTDSETTLYKVYNLPVYHPNLEKSLQYNLEGNYLAITKDGNYVIIPSEAEFVECTIAQGHFCNIRNALYHVTNSDWCLTALYLKKDTAIETKCKLSVSPITKPQAMYLDQGYI